MEVRSRGEGSWRTSVLPEGAIAELSIDARVDVRQLYDVAERGAVVGVRGEQGHEDHQRSMSTHVANVAPASSVALNESVN